MALRVSDNHLGAGKTRQQEEFGDFQTPAPLADSVCKRLVLEGIKPSFIIEPTCGTGSFVLSSVTAFPDTDDIFATDINEDYLQRLRKRLINQSYNQQIDVKQSNFFTTDWKALCEKRENILIIGNLPWVTNAALGVLGSDNLPVKSNFQERKGVDAITGKGNFDISEWMLIKLLEAVNGKSATIAMLCKTAVARKLLTFAWQQNIQISRSFICTIDAKRHFDATVEACLFVMQLRPEGKSDECEQFSTLASEAPEYKFGIRNRRLISNLCDFDRLRHLQAQPGSPRLWRSGVKHDCAKVMELVIENGRLRNGLGETVDIEPDHLYPLVKSSDFGRSERPKPRKWVIVTQETAGKDTASMKMHAPKTWSYLAEHGELLDNRRSSIYQNKPRFSVFGIGEYSFAPWKVGISGFYKNLNFRIIEPNADKPVMLDDTCYFIPVRDRSAAEEISAYLNSTDVQAFLGSFIFWDDKRPVKAELLEQLDLTGFADILRVNTPELFHMTLV